MNDRTTLLSAMAATLVAIVIAFLFAACGPPEKTSASTDVLNLFIWEEYLDPAIKEAFRRETGIRVIESNFGSNEDMLTKLQTGVSFDVVVPSDYMVQVLRRLKLLVKLDHSQLTNLPNIDSYFKTLQYDPEYTHAIPFQWGTTGIAYNRSQLDFIPNSWSYLFNPVKASATRGRLTMLNDPREVIGAALIHLGYSINTTDPQELQKAENLLRAQKSNVVRYDSESFEDSLIAGETVIAHGWSGEFAVARTVNPDIEFVLPREGAVLFVDNLAIPVGAKNLAAAHAFINFLLRPDIAAKVANYSLYGSANHAALPLIDSGVKNGPGFTRTHHVTFHQIEDLGEANALYDQIWTRLKAD
jgi:spermidine/putrescine transport system substrate-binding protein